MGFDPAYRTGCKIAVIDETGKVLDYTTVYPTEPQNDVEGAKKELLKLIEKDKIDLGKMREIMDSVEQTYNIGTDDAIFKWIDNLDLEEEEKEIQ